MHDAPTIALTKSDITLFQTLGGPGRRPCLILYSGADTGRPFALDAGRVVIGRAPDAAVHIDSPGLSRRHAELMVSDDAVTLRDLGSFNGTHVNDRRIEGEVALREGDLVRLGDLLFKFYEHHSLDAALHDRVYRLATIDAGTEVFNRRYLFDTLRREFRLAKGDRRALSVVCYDLDHFKAVNDTYGHPAGDQVLRESATAVRHALMGVGVLGRLGGEEFAVVLPHVEHGPATELAERLRATVADHVFVLPAPGAPAGATAVHRQTISLGVASLTETMQEVIDLFEAADRRLYAAKAGGRDRVGS